MSYNHVLKRKFIGTVIKDGKQIIVSAATKTSLWERPDFVADRTGSLLTTSLTEWKGTLPKDTTEVCSKASQHVSDVDRTDHITAVCYKADGQLTVRHIPVPNQKAEEGDQNKNGS